MCAFLKRAMTSKKLFLHYMLFLVPFIINIWAICSRLYQEVLWGIWRWVWNLHTLWHGAQRKCSTAEQCQNEMWLWASLVSMHFSCTAASKINFHLIVFVLHCRPTKWDTGAHAHIHTNKSVKLKATVWEVLLIERIQNRRNFFHHCWDGVNNT